MEGTYILVDYDRDGVMQFTMTSAFNVASSANNTI